MEAGATNPGFSMGGRISGSPSCTIREPGPGVNEILTQHLLALVQLAPASRGIQPLPQELTGAFAAPTGSLLLTNSHSLGCPYS
jgi:hypothetical protein